MVDISAQIWRINFSIFFIKNFKKPIDISLYMYYNIHINKERNTEKAVKVKRYETSHVQRIYIKKNWLQYAKGIDVYCNGCGKKIKVME